MEQITQETRPRSLRRTIAVDFDGVIHNYSKGYHDGSIYDEPMPGAKDALARFITDGYEVIIFTTRLNPMFANPGPIAQRAQIEKWLDKHGFNKGTHYNALTNSKPAAEVYIDDRGYRHESWGETMEFYETGVLRA